jgi:hypothetical protein
LFPQGCPFDSKFGCASGGGRKPVTGVASNTALNRNGCVDDVAALVAFVAGFVTLSSNQKIAGDS